MACPSVRGDAQRMDIHEQLLSVAGLLRSASAHAARSEQTQAAEHLVWIADRIDPNEYSPGAVTDGSREAIDAAIQRLDAIPVEILPASVPPMKRELTGIIQQLSGN